MQNIRVPGLAWVALIMAVVGWLQGEWFAGEPWVPGVVLMLTAAFAGREHLMKAYGEAMAENYRFLSYGDSMLAGAGVLSGVRAESR